MSTPGSIQQYNLQAERSHLLVCKFSDGLTSVNFTPRRDSIRLKRVRGEKKKRKIRRIGYLFINRVRWGHEDKPPVCLGAQETADATEATRIGTMNMGEGWEGHYCTKDIFDFFLLFFFEDFLNSLWYSFSSRGWWAVKFDKKFVFPSCEQKRPPTADWK